MQGQGFLFLNYISLTISDHIFFNQYDVGSYGLAACILFSNAKKMIFLIIVAVTFLARLNQKHVSSVKIQV